MLKPLLAKKWLDLLKNEAPPGKKYAHVPEEAAKLSQEQKEAIGDFLCQDIDLPEQKAKRAQEVYDQLSDPLKHLVSTAACEIGYLLEHTLIQPCDEKYGIHPSSLFAIPFSSANAPNVGSEFAKPLITLNYTIQAYIKNGFTTDQIRNRLESFLKGIESEGSEAKTATVAKWLKKLAPHSFSSNDPKVWEEIQKRINGTAEDKLEFITDFLLPEMQFFVEQISSNPINLIGMAQNVTGFTGTLWNKTTYDSKLSTFPELGIDSKTLSLLFANCARPVISVKNEKPEEILKTLKEQEIDFDMACDNGAYFKSLSNLDNAQLMAKTYGKPVVFYHQGIQTLTDGAQEKPYQEGMLKEGTYLTFLGQENTTGADVKQKPLAQSFVTIKRGVLLRDILQSVWRLRGLDKGQKVHWVLSSTVEQLIRSDLKLPAAQIITLEDILRYAIQNQAEQLARHHAIACTQQFQGVKQKLLLEVLLSSSPISVKQKAIQLLKPSWIKQENPHCAAQFSQMPRRVETLPELKKEAQAILDFLNEKIEPSARVEQAKREVQAICQRYSASGMLPAQKRGLVENENATVEVEKENQKEVEKEIQQEREGMLFSPLPYIRGTKLARSPIDPLSLSYEIPENTIPYIQMSDFVLVRESPQKWVRTNPPDLLKVTSSLSPSVFAGIHASLNFFQISQSPEKRVSFADLQLYKRGQKDFDYMLFENGRVILLSQQDAEVFATDPNLYSLKAKVFVNQPLRKTTESELNLLVKLKFFAGFSSYTKEEQPLIEKWLKAQNVSVMQAFFEGTVLKCFSLKRKFYRGSFLSKFFESSSK
jgi:hypothetical protein